MISMLLCITFQMKQKKNKQEKWKVDNERRGSEVSESGFTDVSTVQ